MFHKIFEAMTVVTDIKHLHLLSVLQPICKISLIALYLGGILFFSLVRETLRRSLKRMWYDSLDLTCNCYAFR